MAKRLIRRRINKPLSEQDRRRHGEIRAEVEQTKPQIMALGRRIKRRHTQLREAVAALKAARESMGLSLKEIGDCTGIGKANLSRLENTPNPNPTIDTLSRYAEALGRNIEIIIKDLP
jgi:hypothetical protein